MLRIKTREWNELTINKNPWFERSIEGARWINSLDAIEDFPRTLSMVTRFWLHLNQLFILEVNHKAQVSQVSALADSFQFEDLNSDLLPVLKNMILQIASDFRISQVPEVLHHKAKGSVSEGVAATRYWIGFTIKKDLVCIIELGDISDEFDEYMDYFTFLIHYLWIYSRDNAGAFKSNKGVKLQVLESPQNIELSSRQSAIAELIAKGWGNREISRELDFSESLIRKETMKIFKHYSVSTRQDLMQLFESPRNHNIENT